LEENRNASLTPIKNFESFIKAQLLKSRSTTAKPKRMKQSC